MLAGQEGEAAWEAIHWLHDAHSVSLVNYHITIVKVFGEAEQLTAAQEGSQAEPFWQAVSPDSASGCGELELRSCLDHTWEH